MATAWLSVIAATLTGALAWREWWIVGVTFIIPVLVGLQETRRFAALVALAYYGAASWPLMQAFECFGGEGDVSRTAVLTWGLRRTGEKYATQTTT
jgi:hypothetical protein